MITRKQYPSRERSPEKLPSKQWVALGKRIFQLPLLFGKFLRAENISRGSRLFLLLFCSQPVDGRNYVDNDHRRGVCPQWLDIVTCISPSFFSSRDNVHCGDDQTRRSCPARYVAILCTYPPPVSRSLSLKRMRSTKTLLFYNCRITITSICVKHWWFNFLLHSSGTEGGSSCLREANFSLKSWISQATQMLMFEDEPTIRIMSYLGVRQTMSFGHIY